jgi:hypothetical protein
MIVFLLFVIAAIALGIVGAVAKGLLYLLIIGILVLIVDLLFLGAHLRGRLKRRSG